MALSGSAESNFRLNHYFIGYNWSASQSTSGNYSTVKVNIYLRTTGSGYRINSTATKDGYVIINGTKHTFTFTAGIGENTTRVFKTISVNVPHNTDGTKSFTIAVRANVAVTLGGTYYGWVPSSGDLSKSFTLNTIPRYANITEWRCASTDYTSATFSWKTDAPVKQTTILLDKGNGFSWEYKEANINKSSGTLTRTGLQPGRTYTVQFSPQSVASGLWSYSSHISFTTKDVANITSLPGFTAGDRSITLPITNPNGNYIRLYIYIKAKNASGAVIETKDVYIKDINNPGSGNYTLTFSDSDIQTLYNVMKYSTNAQYRIAVCSYRTASEMSTDSNRIFYRWTAYGNIGLNSNACRPQFRSYEFLCDSKTESLLSTSTTNSVLQHYTQATIKISSANKAIGINGADITKYKLTLGETTKEYSYTASDFSVSLGPLSTAGSLSIKLSAVDSRGLESTPLSRTLNVVPYHIPTITASVTREFGYEDSLNITGTGSYSSVNGKNNLTSIKYRYKLSDGSYGTTYTTLPLSYYTITSGTPDKTITLNKMNFLSLDKTSSYSFEMVITDSVSSYTYFTDVAQGVPVFGILENGQAVINCLPDTDNPDIKLQVSGNCRMDGSITLSQTIKSTNYSKTTSSDYSSAGAEINYSNGSITAPNFSLASNGDIKMERTIMNNNPLNGKNGTWNSPLYGTITQTIGTGTGQTSVIVGKHPDGTRCYGIDLIDVPSSSANNKTMRLYAGSQYLEIMSGSTNKISTSYDLVVGRDITMANGWAYLKRMCLYQNSTNCIKYGGNGIGWNDGGCDFEVRSTWGIGFGRSDNKIVFESNTGKAWYTGAVAAPSWNTTSLAAIKTNIGLYNQKASDVIQDSSVYHYNLKSELENGESVEHIGFVIGDNYKLDKTILAGDEKSIDMYSSIGVLWKGEQEIFDELKKLRADVKSLQDKLKEE